MQKAIFYFLLPTGTGCLLAPAARISLGLSPCLAPHYGAPSFAGFRDIPYGKRKQNAREEEYLLA